MGTIKIPAADVLKKIYGETEESSARYTNLAVNFEKKYHHDKAEFFTAPGRTEIIGNHVDHNGGQIIAASIDLDTIGAAYPNGTNVIHMISEGYKQEVVVDLDKLSTETYTKGTDALVAGIMEYMQKKGYATGGFDAYVSTKVIAAAGVSSSASFEMLVCAITNYFFNEGKLEYGEYARAGQYAENVYWKKASGLMDQMASSVGGMIHIDFKEPGSPVVEKVLSDFEDYQYSMCIVDTKASHADMGDDYASIPEEMKKVAKFFGKTFLREVEEDDFYKQISGLRSVLGDRPILRALHFFEEERRVEGEVKALREGDFKEFLELVKDSGNSSFKYLQNIYNSSNVQKQAMSIALAVSDKILRKHGVSRVHGGGFVGTIEIFVENSFVDEYKTRMDRVFGKGSCQILKVRQSGGRKVL